MINNKLEQLGLELAGCGSSYWKIENAIRYSKLEDYEKRYLLKKLNDLNSI